jgi:hypothetical protein
LTYGCNFFSCYWDMANHVTASGTLANYLPHNSNSLWKQLKNVIKRAIKSCIVIWVTILVALMSSFLIGCIIEQIYYRCYFFWVIKY